MAGGGWYDSRYPRDIDFHNSVIPSTSTVMFSTDGELYEINISNITASPISLLIQDGQSTPVAIVPTISIPGNSISLILYQDEGVFCQGGAAWVASASGLVGTVRGRRTTGWHLDSGSTYCNSTGT